MANINNINIEGATIIWKNFSGERDKFNPGKRGFSVVIDDAVMADELRKDGILKSVLFRKEQIHQSRNGHYL